MKKLGLLIVVLLLSIGCNNVERVNNSKKAQIEESDLTESNNYGGISSCDEGKELAEKELKEGKLKYIFGGFGSRQNLPKKLKELYDVEIVEVSGVLGIPNKCYNDVMYAEIQKGLVMTPLIRQ